MSHAEFTRRFTWSMEDNAFSQAVQKRREEGLSIWDLAESNPTQAGFAWSPEELNTAFRSPDNITYNPHPRGLPSARDAVTSYYQGHGIMVSPEQIHLTASTSEGYGWLLKLLTNPG
ncbi:MAG: hypothetical protein LBV12_13285, partial [Puniceicoccales bacterium]|nr:hypothetical protein [Puniceicoccales bacterium]